MAFFNNYSFISTAPLPSKWKTSRALTPQVQRRFFFNPVCLRRRIYNKPLNQPMEPSKQEKRPKSKSNSRLPKAQVIQTGSSQTSTISNEEPIRLRRSGMNSVVVISPQLQQLIGTDMMTRGQVVNHVVQYVKKNNLQREGNRFVCDDTLKILLGVQGEHSILKIHKLLGPHFTKPNEISEEHEQRAEKLYHEYLKQRGAVDSKTVPRKRDPRGYNSVKRQKELKAKGQGMFTKVAIDPCLRPICGGKDKLSRSQVIKALWDYIKKNELQDPVQRRIIRVNDELRQGLKMGDVDTIDCFKVSGYALKLCGTRTRSPNNNGTAET